MHGTTSLKKHKNSLFLYKSKNVVYIVLFFADRASWYDREKKTQHDAQVIFSIFLQQSNQDHKHSSNKNNKYQLLYTYGCTSWWWA